MRRLFIKSVSAAALASCAGWSFAQSYPDRPVKLIVPFPAGTATDIIARLMASEMQRELGQPFVVDNRPGGQGTIAADALIQSPPNGYTLMVTASILASAPALFKKMPFDASRDFTPISRLAYTTLVLMVRKDFPAQTPQELLQQIRARGGKFTAGHGSVAGQVALSQLKVLGGADLVQVPYKGIPAAITDVIGGTIDLVVSDLTNAIAQTRNGQVKVLAITSAQRSPLVPDWPAMAETLQGYNVDAWIALMGPRGLPHEIANRINDAANRAIASKEVQARLRTMGMTPAHLGPTEMNAFFAQEVNNWSRLIKQAGIEPE